MSVYLFEPFLGNISSITFSVCLLYIPDFLYLWMMSSLFISIKKFVLEKSRKRIFIKLLNFFLLSSKNAIEISLSKWKSTTFIWSNQVRNFRSKIIYIKAYFAWCLDNPPPSQFQCTKIHLLPLGIGALTLACGALIPLTLSNLLISKSFFFQSLFAFSIKKYGKLPFGMISFN